MNRFPSAQVISGVALGLVTVALAGCSGGGDEESATTTSSASSSTSAPVPTSTLPEAAQPVAELVSAIEQFGPQGDCGQAVKLITPADLPEPEGGSSARNCQAIQGTLDVLHGFESSDSAEFATAALIDGTLDGKEIALTAALDQTKHFKLTGIREKKGQIDTEPAPEVNFEAPAANFVKALRDDDCTAAHASFATISRLAYANLKQFCSVFEDNFMTDPSGLGARLKADPNAELVDLGGTRNTHFFGLATDPAGYRTIFVGTVGGGDPFVMDVLPVER
jgi:hypothetical protein